MSTTATQQLVRTHQGREIPAPGTYAIDTSHSSVEFVGRHLGLAKVRGRFTRFGGDIQIAETPEQSSVEVDIDVASVESADARRDEHLRSPDFFHVKGYLVLDGVLERRDVEHLEVMVEARRMMPPGPNIESQRFEDEFLRWDPGFRALLDHPAVLPILRDLLGHHLRVDHAYGIRMAPHSSGLGLHGGGM